MSLRSIALLSFCVLLAACSKVNQENYAKLSAGMAKAEVETLLGKPTDCSRIPRSKLLRQHPGLHHALPGCSAGQDAE